MEPLFQFLCVHTYRGQTLMLNDRIASFARFLTQLVKAEEMLTKLADDNPYSSFAYKFQELGFEKGWGNTADRVLQNIRLLLDLLQAPDPDTLENLVARIPMVFTVCIVSPHGYFGQAGLLGMPDTGGQSTFSHCMRSGCSKLSTSWIK